MQDWTRLVTLFDCTASKNVPYDRFLHRSSSVVSLWRQIRLVKHEGETESQENLRIRTAHRNCKKANCKLEVNYDRRTSVACHSELREPSLHGFVIRARFLFNVKVDRGIVVVVKRVHWADSK